MITRCKPLTRITFGVLYRYQIGVLYRYQTGADPCIVFCRLVAVARYFKRTSDAHNSRFCNLFYVTNSAAVFVTGPIAVEISTGILLVFE
jgi:hypothetical protein